MPVIHAHNMSGYVSCIIHGMDRIEVVPSDEFGSCAVVIERTGTGAVWITQNDRRIYVGPEHVIKLVQEIMRTQRVMG